MPSSALPRSPRVSVRSDERPARDVTLGPFCIDLHEVTVADYRACTREKRDGRQCDPAPTTVHWSYAPNDEKRVEKSIWKDHCNGDRAERDNHPINCVDWTMANTYCRWAGRLLPTEAQWEYAARGPDKRKYPWGNQPPDRSRALVSVMYKEQDKWGSTAPVGQFLAGKSAFGAMDMAGNVEEWVQDMKAAYEPSMAMDPLQKHGKLRVIRGGSWMDNDPRNAGVATRNQGTEDERFTSVGFRCAREQIR